MNVTRRSNTSRHRRAAMISATARCRFRAVARVLVVLLTCSFLGFSVSAPSAFADTQVWATNGGVWTNTGSGTFRLDITSSNVKNAASGSTIQEICNGVTTNSYQAYTNGGAQLAFANYSFPVCSAAASWSWFLGNTTSAGSLQYNWGSAAPPPDTTAPTPPTVTLAASGNDVQMSFAAATDNVGITNYRYRDNGGAWTTWAAPIVSASAMSWTGSLMPTVPDKTAAHTVEVQAGDAAGNWSTSGSASWTACTTTNVSNCNTVAPSSGTYNINNPPSCISQRIVNEQTVITGSGGSEWHCIWWSQPPPNRPVHSATFVVKDWGANAYNNIPTIVGWRCYPTGWHTPMALPTSSEGVVNWHGGQERSFPVDCGSDWVEFYLLGGQKDPVNGWGGDVVNNADWQHVTLWWSYQVPATATPDPSATPSPNPVPTSGPSTHPTTNDPGTVTPGPETTDTGGGTTSCAFHWYDPTTYLCGLLNIMRSILDIVRGLGKLLTDLATALFIPTGSQMGAWKGNISSIKSSGVFSLLDTMTNFVTGTFTSAQSSQPCTAETAGSYTNGNTTVSQTSPIHFCQIISNAGTQMQSSDWGSKIYLGAKLLLFVYFALLWYNRLSATAGSQMPV